MRKNIASKFSYLSVIALLAVLATGLFLMSDSTSVSAQKGDIASRGDNTEGRIEPAKEATKGMLTLALNFGAATDYSVFAGREISTTGSTINGKTSDRSDNAAGGKAQTDLLNAFNVLENLPCLQSRGETREGNLRNGSFTPGVYCAKTGSLTGSYILDGNGDPNAIFILRSKGSIRTESDFNITLANGAKSENVFFVAGTSANIAEGITFNGSIIARDTISVGQGSTVNGRIMSVEGDVKMQESSAMLQDGVLQICKTALGPGLDDRIFRFQIGSQIFLVPVGSCSGPITLPAGTVIIDELIDGPTVPSGTFSGRFRLVRVRSDPADAIIDENLPIRRVTVNVRPGNIQNQTVVEFFNTFAVNAIIEICKYPAVDVAIGGTPTAPTVTVIPTSNTAAALGDANIRDRDVLAGTPFEFTVDVLLDTVITVPVGGCSPAIQVNVPTDPGPVPAPGNIRITELAQVDTFGNPIYRLDGDPGTLAASTFPANRLNSIDFNVGLTNTNLPGAPTFFNPGGGVVNVDILEGGVANQTTVNFWNRSEPGYVKICKVAGFGIPIGTLFAFDVYGREPSNTARTEVVANGFPAGTPPPTVPFPGAILPGVDTVRRVIVPAGPGPLGFCEFVRFGSPDPTGGRVQYIAGSQVLVQELGANAISPPAGTTVVTPTSLAPWQIVNAGGGTVTFENGPGTPPLGTGSAELRVGPNGGDFASLRHPGYQGVELADLTALSYSTYVDQDGSGGQAPYLSLRIDLDGDLMTTGDQDTIYFEPVYQTAAFCPSNPQPALALDTWQTWNALNGCWWSNTGLAGGGLGGPPVVPLSAIVALYPNAVIRNDSPSGNGGVRLIAGGGAGAWDNFIGNVDAFSIGVSGVTTTFDFEASAATTPSGGPPVTLPNLDPRAAPVTPIPLSNLPFSIPAGSVGGVACTSATSPTNPCPAVQTDPPTGVRVGNIRLDAGTRSFVSPSTINNSFINAAAICTTQLGNSSTNVAGSATLNPNPSIACRAAIFRARRGTVEVEFTNFLFRPTLLKVCKTGGPGLTTPTGGFSFTVSTGGAGFPTSSTTVTGLLPGSCQFVQGPFTATNTTPIVGTFAFGQDVTITEGTVTGVNVTAFNVLSGSLTPVVAPAINPNLPGRTGTVRLSATTVAGGIAVNEVEFVNAASAAPVSSSFSISGRVMTPDGGGLRNAQVILVGANGQRISVPTSSMGYYSFENLGSQAYRVSVSSRRYRFDARDVELNNSLSALDFTGIE